MGASRKRGHVREWNELLEYLYDRWLATSKVEGMWLTEEIGGRRNFIGVDIIVVAFRYISWWMKHDWTPLKGGRCFLYGDWWDKDNTPPLGIVAEQPAGSALFVVVEGNASPPWAPGRLPGPLRNCRRCGRRTLAHTCLPETAGGGLQFGRRAH